MKAIILAAGRGQRLRQITTQIPKPMLRIQDQIILEHNINWLREYGIREFFINLHHLPEVITEYFGSGSKWDVKIIYSHEEKILGTSGAVRKIVEDFGKRLWDNNFLVIYGDNYFPLSFDVESLIDFHFRKRTLATIGLFDKPDEIHKSGVLILAEDNRVTRFVEKPGLNGDSVTYGLINSGLYVLNKRIIDYIPLGFSDFGATVFPALLTEGVPIYGYEFGEPVVAIDTIEAYEKVAGV
jgi:mannose-1-phosphate guanylyltransferase/phosphomannomutase